MEKISKRSDTRLEQGSMSKDISTQYTSEQNKISGRRGYGMWKHEKETVISPKHYGIFLQKNRIKQKIRGEMHEIN